MSEAEQVKHLIRKLRRRYTYATMERILELPFGTFKKWREGKFHSADLALLRTLGRFPWMIEVADAQYNTQYAKLRLVQAAIERKR